ncbi:MAG: hypothetical protein JWL80_248 [Parcubacteria group bacterium]|nr:hypothetical protein [Parcubacteria group bacterium]
MGIEAGGFDDVPLITHNEINVDGNPRYEPESVAEKIKQTEEVIKYREEQLAALEASPEALSSLVASIGGDVTGEQILQGSREIIKDFKIYLQELRQGGSIEDKVKVNEAASLLFAGVRAPTDIRIPRSAPLEPVSSDIKQRNPYDTSEIGEHIENLDNLIRRTEERGVDPELEKVLEQAKDDMRRVEKAKIERDALRDAHVSEILRGRGNNPEMTS